MYIKQKAPETKFRGPSQLKAYGKKSNYLDFLAGAFFAVAFLAAFAASAAFAALAA